MRKDILEKNNQNKKIIKYCCKCLKELNTDYIVSDTEGNLFCSDECRSDYWREVKKEMDSLLREWNGVD